jgi:hypothetical protein
MKGSITLGGMSQSFQQPLVSEHPDTKVITIELPTGFSIFLENKGTLLNLLSMLSFRNIQFKTYYDERIEIDKEGDLIVQSCDPWINPEWKWGMTIISASDLSEIIVEYVKKEWLN